jgi:hypothetical protein
MTVNAAAATRTTTTLARALECPDIFRPTVA